MHEGEQKYVVGIDLGTTSSKTAIFNCNGELATCVKRSYHTYYPKAGWAEQKESEVLDAVYGSCKEAVEKSGINAKDIVSVSFSVNAGGSMFVDENNRNIRDIIGWQDARAKECLASLIKGMAPFYSITNLPVIPYIGVMGRYQWMHKYQPEIMKQAKMFCTYIDWLQVEFGAKDYYVDSPSACTQGHTNGTNRKYSPFLMKVAGVDEARLPKIVNEPGKIVGHVSESAALHSGLPVGCNICLGAHDMDCVCLGAGAVADGEPIMTVGTIGALSYVSDRTLHSVTQDILSMPKQGQNKWLLRSLNTTSASAFQWFSDALCNAQDGMTVSTQPISFDMIGEAASKSTIGSNGVCFNPNMLDGKGSFSGLSNATTKADMARAIMESIAFNIKKSMEIEKKIGVKSNTIRMTGGAANNSFWCQMFADILNRTIITNNCPEVGCLGAAIFGAVGSGLYVSLEEAVAKMVSEKNRFIPNKRNSEEYAIVYKTWLDSVKRDSKII
jgi:xylulokinase